MCRFGPVYTVDSFMWARRYSAAMLLFRHVTWVSLSPVPACPWIDCVPVPGCPSAGPLPVCPCARVRPWSGCVPGCPCARVPVDCLCACVPMCPCARLLWADLSHSLIFEICLCPFTSSIWSLEHDLKEEMELFCDFIAAGCMYNSILDMKGQLTTGWMPSSCLRGGKSVQVAVMCTFWFVSSSIVSSLIPYTTRTKNPWTCWSAFLVPGTGFRNQNWARDLSIEPKWTSRETQSPWGLLDAAAFHRPYVLFTLVEGAVSRPRGSRGW